MKKSILIGMAVMILVLTACGKKENPPLSASEMTGEEAGRAESESDSEREKLEELRKAPSVTRAVIENRFEQISPHDADRYTFDLEDAVVSVWIPRQRTETYYLDDTQVEQLNTLISEYALTVYEGNPYWPETDNYCTMIELFDFSVDYDKGYYREYGATHYPDGWEDFIHSLRELII